jgi:hypothetical protein
MSRTRRTWTAAAVATTMVMGAALPAAAAAGTHRGEASVAGVLLNLLDSASFDGAVADATAGSADGATAAGAGVSLLEMTASTAASATDATVRAPATGQNCLVPTLPAPLASAPVSAACSDAAATGGDTPSAIANATLVDVSLDGLLLADLVDLLVDGLAQDLTAQIDLALAPLEDTTGELLSPVVDGLAEQCVAGLEQLTDVADEVIDPVTELLANDPPAFVTDPIVAELDDAIEEAEQVLPVACVELVQQLTELPRVNAIVTDVSDALTEALRGLELAQLSVGGSTASVTTDAASVVSAAEAALIQLELPAIGDLTDVVTGLLTDVLDAVVGELSEGLADTFKELVPTVVALVDGVLDAVTLPDLLSSVDPLLTVVVLPASVTSTYDRALGTVATSGAGAVATITLSSAFAALLGEEATTIEVPAGQSMTVLEGTPLESSFTFSDPVAVTRSGEDVEMSGTSVVAAGVDLLTGVNGGVSLQIESVEALAGGDRPSAVLDKTLDADSTLPVTGGGAALGALSLLGLGLGLRRRRD